MSKKYQVSISVKTKADVFKIKGYEGVRVFDESNNVFYFWDKLKRKFIAEISNNISDISLLESVDESGIPINPYLGDKASVTVDNGPGENDGPLFYKVERNKEDEDLELGNRYYLTVNNSTGVPNRELHFELVGFDLTLYLATDSEGELDPTVNILENIFDPQLTEGLDFFVQANGMGNGVCHAGLTRTQFSGGGDNVIIGTPGTPGKMLFSEENNRIYLYTNQWVYWDYTVI